MPTLATGRYSTRQKTETGFTLIEILVVLAILAVFTVSVSLSLNIADPARGLRLLDIVRENAERLLLETRQGQRRLVLQWEENELHIRSLDLSTQTTTAVESLPLPEGFQWTGAEINERRLATGERREFGAEAFPLLTLSIQGKPPCLARLSANAIGKVSLVAENCQ